LSPEQKLAYEHDGVLPPVKAEPQNLSLLQKLQRGRDSKASSRDKLARANARAFEALKKK